MAEILSGGRDMRSASGVPVGAGCAANGFAGPPNIPVICTRVGVGHRPKPKVDTQEIARRGIEDGSHVYLSLGHSSTSCSVVPAGALEFGELFRICVREVVAVNHTPVTFRPAEAAVSSMREEFGAQTPRVPRHLHPEPRPSRCRQPRATK